MTIKYADRVKETTASIGTGDLTLTGAVPAFRTINIVFDNDFDGTGLSFDYLIRHDTNNTWEIGTGHLTTATTMSRDTVINTSDEGLSKINFASGGLKVTVTPLKDTLENFELATLTANTSVITDLIDEKTAAAGVTVDGVLLKDSEVSTDVINEKTPDAGVTIDGILLKDGQILIDVIDEKTPDAGVTVDGVLLKDSEVSTDVINEKTGAVGVTIDGVLLKDNQVFTDIINEITAALGVTVDGVLLKDSQVSTDVINEITAALGVTIDGVLLKDTTVEADSISFDGGTNLLGDYVKGSFTPVISDGTNDAAAYFAQVGRFIRIGDMCFGGGRVNTNGLGSVSGQIRIKDLPFTAVTQGDYSSGLMGHRGTGLALTAGTNPAGSIGSNSAFAQLFMWSTSAGTSSLSNAEWTADGDLHYSFLYEVA